MFLQTYVKATLLLAGVPQALVRRAGAKKAEDGGLATLEWVALIIVAVGLAAAAGTAIKIVLDNKLAQIK